MFGGETRPYWLNDFGNANPTLTPCSTRLLLAIMSLIFFIGMWLGCRVLPETRGKILQLRYFLIYFFVQNLVGNEIYTYFWDDWWLEDRPFHFYDYISWLPRRIIWWLLSLLLLGFYLLFTWVFVVHWTIGKYRCLGFVIFACRYLNCIYI